MNRRIKQSLFLLIIGLLLPMHLSSQWNGRHNNYRKLSVKADKENGEYYDIDNTRARSSFNTLRLQDPFTGKIPVNIREKEMQFARQQVRNLPDNRYKSAMNEIEWKSRGPYNVGGRTRALAIDARNPGIILAGGVSGGMWRSEDEGKTWEKTTGPSDHQSVTAIAQDPRSGHQDTWYYTTGEFEGNSADLGDAYYRGNGVFKSTDNGKTWSPLASTAFGEPQVTNDFDFCYNVVVNPVNGNIYVAVLGKIMISSDGGDSWTEVFGEGFNLSYYTDIACSSTGILYATLSSQSFDKGIYRSIDGQNWVKITPAGFPFGFNRIVLDIAPSNEDIVYFLAETPGSGYFNATDNEYISLWKYKYLSGDGSGFTGGEWTNLSDNLPSPGGEVGNFNSQGSYNMVIKVKPDNPDVVFIGGTNLYRSNDGFSSKGATTWIGGYSPANDITFYQNQHPDQHSLVFYPGNPRKMLAGHDGGISLTNDNMGDAPGYTPVKWELLNNGYLTTQAYTIAIKEDKKFDNSVLSGFQDNGSWYTFTDSASYPWFEEFSGDGAFCAFANAENGHYRYVSSQNGNIYRFQYDNADNFIDFTRVTPKGVDDLLFINPFALDPNNDKVMYYAGGDRIFRNDDLTAIPAGSNEKTYQNWVSIPVTVIFSGSISYIAVSKTPANVVYYGTSAGELYRVDNAHDNSLATLTNIAKGKGLPIGGYVSSIHVAPDDADEVLVTFSNYNIHSVYHSGNGGNSWINISGNLEENPDGSGNGPSVRSITRTTAGNGKYWYVVGTSTGLYYTGELNGMSTVWSPLAQNTIGNVVVPMVKSRDDGMVFAGTHGNGIFTGLLPVVEQLGDYCFSTNQLAGWTSNTVYDIGTTGNPAISLVSTSSDPVGFSSQNCDYFIEFNAASCDSGDAVRLVLDQPVSTIGYTSNELKFNWLRSTSGAPDSVVVQYSTDKENWLTANGYARYTASSAFWDTITCQLPPGADDQDSLYLAFLFKSANGSNCYIDHVEISGNMHPAPPTLVSAKTSEDGTYIVLEFDKSMDINVGKEGQFSLVTDKDINVASISLDDSTFYKLNLALDDEVFYGQDAYLTYKKGTVDAADGGLLQSFTNIKIVNNVVINSENENTIKIIGNPNRGQFRYQYTSKENSRVTINVLDISGRTVYSEEINKLCGTLEGEINLPFSYQGAGVYIMQVINNKKVATAKVVVE